jgi:histone acetyltransferase (RNA polymerase elongator complex component)
MNPINIEEALNRNENVQAGLDEYKRLEQKANSIAEEISSTLIESIVKEEDKFNITTAILAVAKSLSHLSSYLYDTEEEFLTDVKKARTATVSDVIPALLDPQPCGNCMSCKDGKPMECINPQVRGDYTTSRFLPVLCNMVIEYDLFNKIMHMHTVGKEEKKCEVEEAVTENKEG